MKTTSPALLTLFCLAISGCGGSDSPNGGSASSRADQSVSYTVSEDEAQQFGLALEAAHRNNDSAAASALVDLNRAAEAAVADFALKEVVKRQMSGGLAKGIYEQFGDFLGVVNQGGADETSYGFLRTASRGRRRVAIFRLVSPTGLNYHELYLVKDGDKVVAEDFYILLAGAKLSEVWKQSLLPLARVEQARGSWTKSPSKADQAVLDSLDDATRCREQFMSQRFSQALATWNQLPRSVQETKAMLIMRYQIASNISPEEVSTSIAEYRRIYPNDPALDFLQIDAYIINEEFDKALDSLERIDAAVGTDPYLDSLRANVKLLDGEATVATELIEKALAAVPEVVDVYWTAAGVYLQTGNHSKLSDLLSEMERTHNIEFENLRTVPEYAGFVASPEGQAWMRARGM